MGAFTKDRLKIECICGCGTGFTFDYIDDAIIVSTTVGYFYVAQHSMISTLKKKLRILFGKNECLEGAVITRDNVKQIVRWLEEHSCQCEKENNYGAIKLAALCDPTDKGTENELYELLLYSIMSPIDILVGKQFKAGEIVVDDKLRRLLIKHFNQILLT